MNNPNPAPEKQISLPRLAQAVKNANFEDEVVVFETSFENSDNNTYFPIRFDALLIVMVTGGVGRIGIDLKEYDIRKDTLIVLQPKNYITLSQYSQTCTANVIACSRGVVEDVHPKLTDVLPLLLQHRTEPVTHLTENEAQRLEAYFHFIKHNIEEPHGLYTKPRLMALLQAAMYEMLDINQQGQRETKPRTRKDEIMAKFILSVSENFREHREVSWYADELCITPKHLSAVVKEMSGHTAGEWIDNYVIMESKVLLKSTDLTIQEVSDKMQFKNQSFFGKFFKHHTGLTPTDFRRKN